MSSRQFLDELRSEIADSAICSELAAQATRLVMGSGNPNADIVLSARRRARKRTSRAYHLLVLPVSF